MKIESIVVFRALEVGQMICSLPALRALRKSYPSAHITLVSLAENKSHFKKVVDEFISFSGLPDDECNPVEVLGLISKVRKRRFDLAIQLQDDGKFSNPLVRVFKARKTIGYYKKGNYCPDPLYFREYPEHLSEMDRCLSLINDASTLQQEPVWHPMEQGLAL
jgi:ADP-heptose:LPS heptosyltransferase